MENPRQVSLSPYSNPTLFLKLCGKPEHLHHISKCLYRLRTPEIEAKFSHIRSLEKSVGAWSAISIMPKGMRGPFISTVLRGWLPELKNYVLITEKKIEDKQENHTS